ncbi:MAG: bifunctional RNase H/acid phosphatase [Antricoccus sp.]
MTATIRYIAEADGGSRGNPGPAGFGAVIRDARDDLVIAERAESIGIATNNVAEYRGLISALEAARELAITELDMRMDSKLCVEQISGRWKTKNAALQPLALRARRLADEFDRITFTWIPRAQNSHADRLANEAMDAAAKGQSWSAANSTAESVVIDQARAVPAPPDGPVQEHGSLVTAHPNAGMATVLILLRHGETEQSLERRFSGRTDLPLTDLGRAQAAAAAKRIAGVEPITAIFSSPLLRAKQTAHAVGAALGLDVQIDDRLREIDFGAWEGMTFVEARHNGGEWFKQWARDSTISPPGGESQSDCLERVSEARRDIVRNQPGSRVLIVTHMTPVKMLLAEVFESIEVTRRINLDLASISRVDYPLEAGRSVVKLVNEISHLGSL